MIVKINFFLTWSVKCMLSNDTKATVFATNETKLYALVVNSRWCKFITAIKSAFKRTINRNKY